MMMNCPNEKCKNPIVVLHKLGDMQAPCTSCGAVYRVSVTELRAPQREPKTNAGVKEYYDERASTQSK
jgi:hypothetical protein